MGGKKSNSKKVENYSHLLLQLFFVNFHAKFEKYFYEIIRQIIFTRHFDKILPQKYR